MDNLIKILEFLEQIDEIEISIDEVSNIIVSRQ
jgi:hypothetical protein